jgi:hypothetical protein
MKLVFFSGDRREVERVEQALAVAGIPCKVRGCTRSKGAQQNLRETELWVVNDRDCSRAFLLCVEAGGGFAKPTAQFAQKRLWDETLAA